MMMTTLMTMPTLAAGFEEVVAVSIGVIIMVGSALGQALKNRQSQKPGPTGPPGEGRAKLDELAAKRRAEMEAEAQRRRASAAGGQRPARGDASMTMAERMRQTEQRSAERAAAIQQALEQQLRDQLVGRAPPPAPRPQPARRQQPGRSPAPPQRQRPMEHAPRPVQAQQRSARPASPQQPHYAAEHDQVHRLLTPLDDAPASPVVADRGRFDLRQAMIWKEILDKPVALRDPADGFFA